MEKYSPGELIHRYIQGLCSEEECALIESWHLKDLADSTYIPSKEEISLVQGRIWNRLSSHLSYNNPPIRLRSRKLWPHLAIATSILFVISIVSYLYVKTDPFSKMEMHSHIENDIAPGNDKAILTLNNGKKILLNESIDGLIAMEGNVSISKSVDGKLVYKPLKKISGLATENKLETPAGGKYSLVLPDGTKVWLNSVSRLSYPTKFDGNERKVFLQGEAYFEVAKNKKKPFKIITNQQTVEVLGTHFNIKAYADENQVQTTLLAGRVQLFKGSQHKILAPGETAWTNLTSENIQIRPADIEKELAWKNNEFIFNGEDLKSIMIILARWYDVEVIYGGPQNETKYWGVISRSKNLSEVLKMLQSTGKINFKIQGRRITLMN